VASPMSPLSPVRDRICSSRLDALSATTARLHFLPPSLATLRKHRPKQANHQIESGRPPANDVALAIQAVVRASSAIKRISSASLLKPPAAI
jgi:hypothetical protein